jgi:hypothetical protein
MKRIFMKVILIFNLFSLLNLDYAFIFQKPNIFDAVFTEKDEVP